MPLISDSDIDISLLNWLEKKLISVVDELQIMLIQKKAHKLKIYAQA